MSPYEQLCAAFSSRDKYTIWSAKINIPTPCPDFEHLIPELFEVANGDSQGTVDVPDNWNFMYVDQPPESLQAVAWHAIGRIGSPSGKFGDLLNSGIWDENGEPIYDLSDDNEEDIFLAAIESISSCGNDNTLKFLINEITKENPNIYARNRAIRSIGGFLAYNKNHQKQMPGIETLATVVADNSDSNNRLSAAFALGLSENPSAFDPLYRCIYSCEDYDFIERYVIPAMEKVGKIRHVPKLAELVVFGTDGWEVIPSERLANSWPKPLSYGIKGTQAHGIAANVVRGVIRKIFDKTSIFELNSLSSTERNEMFEIMNGFFQIEQLKNR